MHFTPGFTLRTIMGEPIIVAEGAKQVNFNKLISFNSSAALIWKAFEGKEFNVADVAQKLVDEYEIDAETANRDAQQICDKWLEVGLLEK